MHYLRQMPGLQKFAAAHSSVFDHFNQGRSLSRRNIFKLNRSAASPCGVGSAVHKGQVSLLEWRLVRTGLAPPSSQLSKPSQKDTKDTPQRLSATSCPGTLTSWADNACLLLQNIQDVYVISG